MRLLLTSALAPVALCASLSRRDIPNASPKPLPTDCSPYPNYNNSTGTAGPFTIIADSTGSTFDGNKINAEYFTNDGKDRFGFITMPKYPTSTSISLFCTPTLGLSAHLSAPANDTPISIASEENWQAAISFNMRSPAPGIPIEPFAHIVNGTQQPGVYLGARNTTTWTFRYNWGGNAGEYFLLRLMGVMGKEATRTVERRQEFTPPPISFPPDDRDWVGFLRVVG
ncbi:hypothetical protein EJ04DRAFT_521143 [Polyplosphaeria fusca]|uniref:Uncharacterized protein n=1 Tax=Polyplosphaeria fusca TaxID=682080 RepID=A0A9P4R5X5_9PLEO|nr:hypothetical protein EJ04DRAFT_521143 [Polyplosphaeria fusca]